MGGYSLMGEQRYFSPSFSLPLSLSLFIALCPRPSYALLVPPPIERRAHGSSWWTVSRNTEAGVYGSMERDSTVWIELILSSIRRNRSIEDDIFDIFISSMVFFFFVGEQLQRCFLRKNFKELLRFRFPIIYRSLIFIRGLSNNFVEIDRFFVLRSRA